jgi:hypothetical protein
VARLQSTPPANGRLFECWGHRRGGFFNLKFALSFIYYLCCVPFYSGVRVWEWIHHGQPSFTN